MAPALRSWLCWAIAAGMSGGASGAGLAHAANTVGASTRERSKEELAAVASGVKAFRGGGYAEAERALRSAAAKDDDWVLYLHAEAAFYAGMVSAARADFERLAHARSNRLADMAAFRAADCLWVSGARSEAAERYRRLLPRVAARGPSAVDPAVARYRVALDAEARRKPEAGKLFLALYRDLPAHPLALEARKHLPASSGPAAREPPGDGLAAPGAATAADHLRRAETLTRDRHWQEALDELAKLGAGITPAQAVERDFQIGMTKFQMRRDYGKAAELLLKVAPALTGDKAASALFHGTRALSRVDRDDEAISGYQRLVARHPQSRYAAEAQFLSGWLDYNRGRYRESLPGLRATLERFGTSAFSDDAAWCIAFAHFLLGELSDATAALDRYSRMPTTGMTIEERSSRVAYWRARIEAKAGRLDQAQAGYRELNRRWPFTFYGVAARSRLLEMGQTAAPEVPRKAGATFVAPQLVRGGKEAAIPSAVLLHADELAAVGLDVEAGWELQREEKAILQRAGDSRGMFLLFSRYPRYKAFRRAYELSEGRHGGALSFAPEADSPVRRWWEAAYPKAYSEQVERYGPPAGNPDLLLYAIMRKESGFSPWDVSSADARGLLQMIPPTSARMAATLGIEFFPDELFDPETNIRLGAAYIGGLAKKFHGQIPLVAGAFNAGPKAMAKWCDQHGGHPMDEFVELIAFTQTREYAKRVVAIFSRYRHLYGPSPYQMLMKVDPKFESTGPDY